MGTSKPPPDTESGVNKALGRGLAAYQQTLKQKHEALQGEAQGLETRKGGPAPKGGFLKTGPRKPPGRSLPDKASKYRKVAQFLVLVGSDKGADILSRLENEQVEAVSREIVNLKGITPEEGEAVLDEFRSLLSAPYTYSGSSAGGIEAARRLLYAAFGPEKGEAFIKRTVPESADNPFDFLADYSGEQLALFFRDESPAAEALVLSRLPSKQSAAVLANTSGERKLEIIKRIAHLREISPEVLDRTASALRERARLFGSAGTASAIDGIGALRAILKHSDVSFGDRLLEELGETDPGLGRELKDRLYTLEDVSAAADRPIQEKLRSMPDRDIALLIKGRSGAFTGKILGNLSSAREARVREEEEILGQVPKIETEAAAREFLAWFRLNREEGRILMMDDRDVIQ
ncbi:MAG: flagellar motor switch protein FliG [Treponema sp.]|jgi:flagellar motor switch protein FliG|nr:flagellar motor switch protein FliG [Treponema sp.]